MNIILLLSLFIGLGFIFGKLAAKIKLPTVSGYLIAGLLFSISQTVFKFDIVTSNLPVLNYLSEITLSFIAFGIGSEFVFSELKKSGKSIFIITLLEVLGAIIVVFILLYLLVPVAFPSFTSKERFIFSLILGTMSAATAPAATILVIKQFKTKGPLTKTILPVVALDDVLGIIAFGIALPIARILTPLDPSNTIELTFFNIIKGPIIEVFGSLIVGAIIGFILVLVSKITDPKDELQVKSIFFVLIGLGISNLLNLSPLLVNIMIGTILANLKPKEASRSFKAINEFVPVFYILFFTIAGATLNIKILTTVGIIGLVYVLARALGKIIGTILGASLAKSEPSVKKYLAFALLPQGGISIGLSILVRAYLPVHLSNPIITIILFSILIYESTGPIFAKLALQKADELYKLDDAIDLELN